MISAPRTTAPTRRRRVPHAWALFCVVGVFACAESGATPSEDRGRGGSASQSPTLRKAVEALERNRPWLATELLSPLLKDSTKRTPEAVLVAAKAAAAYKGWSRVDDVLRGEEWLDQLAEGEGRLLLARAAHELRRSDAIHQALLTLDSKNRVIRDRKSFSLRARSNARAALTLLSRITSRRRRPCPSWRTG